MKTSLVLTALLLGLSLHAQQGTPEAALKSSYEISVGGVTRSLTVVTDELAIKQGDGSRSITKTTPGDAAREARALRARGGTAHEVEIVMSERADGPKTPRGAAGVRHFATKEILVRLKPGKEAGDIAKSTGVKISSAPAHAPGYVVLTAITPEQALAAMEALRALPEVESANVMLATQKGKKHTPNDPLFPEQWHHRNTSQLGGALWIDTGITTAWDLAKGTGITIGILDDGVQHTHPDLQPNYNTAIDYDFNSNDADPAPVSLTQDSHGTSCAGVAAARGNNGIGVSGAAPLSTLAGFRLIAAPSTDQQEADAFLINNNVIQIKSNSWGIPDGSGYGGLEPLARAALETGVTSGRGGKGVIYLFAGGNGLLDGDDSNLDSYANNPFVIAVGAVNDFGFQTWYSEPGANLLLSAPSAGGGLNQGIRTTDLTGNGGSNTSATGTDDLADRNYTNSFGGTSSACPLVAGVVALMLEVNPNLGWRDVKEILLLTARKNHRADLDWATNAAGLSFNHKYGAGMLDAAAAVALAQQWVNLPAMTIAENADTGLFVSIPDNNATGVTRTITIPTANFRVEHVSVTLTATHTAIGDLEVTLTSPSGMVSKLSSATPDDTNNMNWTFGSVRHWGESAAGPWTVKVADRLAGDIGTLNSVSVKCYGTVQERPRIIGLPANTTLVTEGNTPANNVADPGEAVTFNLNLSNLGFPATNVTASLLAAGGVSEPGPAQNYGAMAGGGQVSRPFSFRLSGGCGTSVPLILRLQDGATEIGHVTLVLPLGTTVTATPFTSSGGILFTDNSPGRPSPSNIIVAGLNGRVQRLTADVNGFTHPYPNDMGILLRGPAPLKMLLMSGGTSQAATNVNLAFDDSAARIFPDSGLLTSGSYRPWAYYGSSRVFTGDTAAEMAYTFGEFLGLPANGTWNLFTQDFVAGDSGRIGLWRLNFTTVTCTDNVMLAQAATTDGEGAGSIVVSVLRTGGLEGSAAVNYATTNGTATAGSDYTSTSGTLSFAVGELVKTFSIPVTNDTTMEDNETIQVTLSAATGNTTLGTLASGTVTIEDNDTLTPVALSPATPGVTEAATSLTFTVSRAAAGGAGTIDWSTTVGTATSADFQQASGTVTFGAADLSKTFNVQILNDNLPEEPESFTVALQSPTGVISMGSPTSATVTITDGDADGDTLSDDFETSSGLNPAVHDSSLDSDGDGLSNMAEYIIGSAPNSGASQFKPGAAKTGNDVGISFPTLTGRTYKVETSATLVEPWATLQANIAGTGSIITVPDTGGGLLTKKFYRVIVTKP